MGYYHKSFNIIRMNKLSEVLLSSSNMCFKNVIESGKHLKSVKKKSFLLVICYGMDIFPGHVTFDDQFKQFDWLLR